MFIFPPSKKHRHKHAKTPHLNRKAGHRPKIAKIHSSMSAQEKTKRSNMFKSLPLLFSLWSPGAPSLPSAPSSATLSDKWGRPQAQGSNMLFQDPKRKKSPGQLHRIWWQTPFPEVETATMHNKVPCLKGKHCKNTVFHERARKDKVFKHVQKIASFSHSV